MADISQAIFAGITQAITSLSAELVKVTAAAARTHAEKLLVEFQVGFRAYVERNYDRCSKVKTLLHRYEPVSIETAYVAPRLRFGKNTIPERDFLPFIAKAKRIVITGIAGSGKSMLLKHTFVQLC